MIRFIVKLLQHYYRVEKVLHKILHSIVSLAVYSLPRKFMKIRGKFFSDIIRCKRDYKWTWHRCHGSIRIVTRIPHDKHAECMEAQCSIAWGFSRYRSTLGSIFLTFTVLNLEMSVVLTEHRKCGKNNVWIFNASFVNWMLSPYENCASKVTFLRFIMWLKPVGVY